MYLPVEKAVAVLRLLLEGNSVSSTWRLAKSIASKRGSSLKMIRPWLRLHLRRHRAAYHEQPFGTTTVGMNDGQRFDLAVRQNVGKR